MADIEKVIKCLEACTGDSGDCAGHTCPYWDFDGDIGCRTQMELDALNLLKEQEAIMIKTVMINGSGRNGRCQNCLMMLNEMDYPNFCGNCGQAVKWE